MGLLCAIVRLKFFPPSFNVKKLIIVFVVIDSNCFELFYLSNLIHPMSKKISHSYFLKRIQEKTLYELVSCDIFNPQSIEYYSEKLNKLRNKINKRPNEYIYINFYIKLIASSKGTLLDKLSCLKYYLDQVLNNILNNGLKSHFNNFIYKKFSQEYGIIPFDSISEYKKIPYMNIIVIENKKQIVQTHIDMIQTQIVAHDKLKSDIKILLYDGFIDEKGVCDYIINYVFDF